MESIVIHRAQLCHAEEIAAIEAQLFSRPWSRQAVETEIENPNAIFLVCIADGGVVGYVSAQTVFPECYLGNLAVKAVYQRRGIGAALLKTLISELKEHKYDFVSLEVRVSNEAAIRLYEKLGFCRQGERKNFYSEPTENAAIYTLFFSESEAV